MLRSWLAALRKWIRTSAGLYISLAFAVLLGAQETPRAERVRFLDGRTELCEVLGKDGDGVSLKVPGVPKPVKFPWWQLDPADAARLRGGEGAAPPGPAAEFAVDGVRVRLADGKVVDGVLMPGAPAHEVWI